MKLIDWPARWDPVPRERAGRVWLPQPRRAVAPPRTSAAARLRDAQRVVLVVPPAQAEDLAVWVPRLPGLAEVGNRDEAIVDLGGSARVHLTGLALLLDVLWRRVGPHGRVSVVGGSPALQAQLRRLGLTGEARRAELYGTSPAVSARAPIAPAHVAVAVPAPRRDPDEPRRLPDGRARECSGAPRDDLVGTP